MIAAPRSSPPATVHVFRACFRDECGRITLVPERNRPATRLWVVAERGGWPLRGLPADLPLRGCVGRTGFSSSTPSARKQKGPLAGPFCFLAVERVPSGGCSARLGDRRHDIRASSFSDATSESGHRPRPVETGDRLSRKPGLIRAANVPLPGTRWPGLVHRHEYACGHVRRC